MRRPPLSPHAVVIDLAGATALRHEAWWSGKHAGEPRTSLPPYPRASADDLFVILAIPMVWIERDHLTELGCDNPDRGRHYAQLQIDMPIDLRVPRRRGDAPIPEQMRVMDGGHRTAAARLRGDSHVPALVKLADLCDFMTHHGYPATACQAAPEGVLEILHRLALASASMPLDKLLCSTSPCETQLATGDPEPPHP